MLFTPSWILDILLFLTLVLFLVYKYLTRNFNYWKDRNVFYEKPLPLLGNFKEVIALNINVAEWFKKQYYIASKVPYFGIFIFDEPHLVVKSPQLIKNIMIRDFNYFKDRSIAYPKHDEVVSNFLFMMPNPQWKTARSQLTPTFTSGKLKGMFTIILKVGERLQNYITENQGILEAKEITSKYSTDVIANCFFGINSHCFDDENATFRVLGRSIFDFRLRNAISQASYFFMHNFVRLFKIHIFESWITQYFVKSFRQAFELREKSKERKNDFIDVLRDMKEKGELQGNFNIEEIHGASMQFFIAGFETTSAIISFTLYELSLNKNIQNKLREEIVNNIKENEGITYDGVIDMKYLDMCVKETLRKYPVLPFLDRKCLSDYKVPDSDLVIEKGTNIYIPTLGLHYDEQYFPEPNTYNPERFASIQYNEDGLVYVPFGEGPRICIGERFGLMSTKLGVIHVIRKFEVEKCDKTPDVIEFEPKSFVLQSNVGLPIRFKPVFPTPA